MAQHNCAHSYQRENVHLLFVPEDLQHAGTYGTTGSRWGDRQAAWSGQRGAGNHTARRVWGQVRHGPHSMAGALIVHSYAVREGITYCIVGLTIMATNLLRLPTGILAVAHISQGFPSLLQMAKAGVDQAVSIAGQVHTVLITGCRPANTLILQAV